MKLPAVFGVPCNDHWRVDGGDTTEMPGGSVPESIRLVGSPVEVQVPPAVVSGWL